MLLVNLYHHEADRVAIVTIQDVRSAESATAWRTSVPSAVSPWPRRLDCGLRSRVRGLCVPEGCADVRRPARRLSEIVEEQAAPISHLRRPIVADSETLLIDPRDTLDASEVLKVVVLLAELS